MTTFKTLGIQLHSRRLRKFLHTGGSDVTYLAIQVLRNPVSHFMCFILLYVFVWILMLDVIVQVRTNEKNGGTKSIFSERQQDTGLWTINIIIL